MRSSSHLLALLFLWFLPFEGLGEPLFRIVSGQTNDLRPLLEAAKVRVVQHSTSAEAFSAAQPGDGLLLLADGYPSQPLEIDQALLESAAAKKIRVYLEFPASIPGLELGETKQPVWERLVVAREGLPKLPLRTILMAHGMHLRPVPTRPAWIVSARVAGYNEAVYGIPPSATPILFQLDSRPLLVATTKLSGCVTGRFGPTDSWAELWQQIFAWLCPEVPVRLSWISPVRPAYGPTEQLPSDAGAQAFRKTVEWLENSGLLISGDRAPLVRQALLRGEELLTLSSPPAVWRPPFSVSDGRYGILEGYSSQIQHTGDQLQRAPIRADCQAESAMLFALDFWLHKQERSRLVASNLLDFLYFTSDLCQGPRADPAHPAYGLIGWGSTAPAWVIANYGDDNARAMLGTMLTAAALGSSRWEEPLLRALRANLRTTGKLGFRGDRIDLADLEKNGWKHYHEASPINHSPHFESYNWAAFLWAARRTGESEFLEKTKSGIRIMMDGFPDKWRWNDNMERARMLLCLSWLVRLEDAPEHRRWLRTIVEDLLAIQEQNGGFAERFRGKPGSHYQIPASNEAYGTGETPLIQKNGDPVTDQLYVSGFLLFGLREASAALGDPAIAAAETKLAAYLCRTQTRSEKFPHLSGTWFRAFDFARWEPWASSGDAGWGAWSIEAGWAQVWGAAALALRARNTNFWDLTEK